jgi:hypothetical protein
MVIDQFNVKSVRAFKTKDNPPISAHGDRPEASQVASERVQPVAGQIHRLRGLGRIKAGQNILNPGQQIRPYLARVAAFIQAFQPSVFEAFNHDVYL